MLGILFVCYLVLSAVFIKFMFIQLIVIPKLSKENKFRLWWERHITSPIDFEK